MKLDWPAESRRETPPRDRQEESDEAALLVDGGSSGGDDDDVDVAVGSETAEDRGTAQVSPHEIRPEDNADHVVAEIERARADIGP